METHSATKTPRSLEDRISYLEQLLGMHEDTIELQAARISVFSLAIASLIHSQPPNPLFAETLRFRIDAMLARGDASPEFRRYVMDQVSQVLAANGCPAPARATIPPLS